MKCGEKIKHFREMIGMSQDELAQKTDYAGRSAISRIEKGQRNLKQSKVILFAGVLGVNPNEIMDDREPTEIICPVIETDKQKLIALISQLPDEHIPIYRAIFELSIEQLQAVVSLLR